MPSKVPMGNSIPVSVWKEKDSIGRETVDVLVMILKGRGCCWAKNGGCTMCGYNEGIDGLKVTPEELLDQVEYAMERYDEEPYIKIFTSGSFLDTEEIPIGVQRSIFNEISGANSKVRLLVESRPEFVDKEQLLTLSRSIQDIEIAIGLETSSDRIRAEHIRKGFTWDDYLKAGRMIKELDLKLKTYLLLKPPLLGENAAINDCLDSITDISRSFPGSRVSVNPMNIQKGTDVEALYRKGLYRSPWLWSLVEVLKVGRTLSNGQLHLMSSPTAGGKDRGTHNCGNCDQLILKAIEDFSLCNDTRTLDGLSHHCLQKWEEYLVYSTFSPM